MSKEQNQAPQSENELIKRLLASSPELANAAMTAFQNSEEQKALIEMSARINLAKSFISFNPHTGKHDFAAESFEIAWAHLTDGYPVLETNIPPEGESLEASGKILEV